MRGLPLHEHLRVEALCQTFFETLQLADVVHRREVRQEQRSFRCFYNSGIAIINWSVIDYLRPAPGFAVVFRAHQFQSAERADMRFASSGKRE